MDCGGRTRGADADGTAEDTTWSRWSGWLPRHPFAGVLALRFGIANAGDLVKAVVRRPGPRVRKLTTRVHQARRFAAGA